jgi:ABC-type lipoprotein release transport system permease subunit
LVIGLCGAAASARIVSSLLFSVSPAEPIVFAVAAGGMIAIALVATGIPARRAMKVDPIVALRTD